MHLRPTWNFAPYVALFALIAGCGTEVTTRGRSGSENPDQVTTDTGLQGDATGDTVDDTGIDPADTTSDSGTDTSADTAPDTTVACTSDLDCRGGEVCRDGACREACGPTDPCTGALTVCDPDARICVGCAADSDCANGESCVDGNCRFVCSVNADCAPGQRCEEASGNCLPGCDTDVDCPGGQRCDAGTCVAIVPEVCSPFASACDANDLLVCLADGSAFERTPCAAGTRCIADVAGAACEAPICTPGASTCADSQTLSICATDGFSEELIPCEPGAVCSAGVCRATTVCTPNALSCVGGDAYRCNATGTANTLADTCTATEVCSAGACVSTAGRCTTGLDCPALPTSCDGNVRVSFRAGGSCVAGTCDYSAVVRRTNCELAGQVCDDATASCVTPACTLTEADCPGDLPLLDPIACTCVACLSDGDCTGGQICSAGLCVGGGTGGCTTNAQCTEQAIALGGTAEGASCDLNTGTCFTLSTCGAGDIFNAECPSGTTCQTSPLIGGTTCSGCSSSSQCRTGESCFNCIFVTGCFDSAGGIGGLPGLCNVLP